MKLDKGNLRDNYCSHRTYREKMNKFINSFNLIDIIRVHNPNKEIHTWSRGKSYSRLDYFLCSKHLLNSKITTEIKGHYLSDHYPIKLTINNYDIGQKGKGTWKFNSSLLQDKNYTDMMTTCLLDYINCYISLPN